MRFFNVSFRLNLYLFSPYDILTVSDCLFLFHIFTALLDISVFLEGGQEEQNIISSFLDGEREGEVGCNYL